MHRGKVKASWIGYNEFIPCPLERHSILVTPLVQIQYQLNKRTGA